MRASAESRHRLELCINRDRSGCNRLTTSSSSTLPCCRRMTDVAIPRYFVSAEGTGFAPCEAAKESAEAVAGYRAESKW